MGKIISKESVMCGNCVSRIMPYSYSLSVNLVSTRALPHSLWCTVNNHHLHHKSRIQEVWETQWYRCMLEFDEIEANRP